MNRSLLRPFHPLHPLHPLLRRQFPSPPNPRLLQQRSYANSPADDPNFTSILDQPPQLIRSGRKKHGPGLIVLAAIPLTAFALGTWQVKRLEQKTNLITLCSERLIRPPLPLPLHIDTSQLSSFDYRRVLATGVYRHDQEMLLGPRINEGENGYQVITPLERPNGSTILVSRGWIPKDKKEHRSRAPEALPRGTVTVQGLLRKPWVKNMFTPDNRPEVGEFYFPDVMQMAGLVGAQPVWVEETTDPDYIVSMNNRVKGIPIARAAAVDIRNNHMQYIFTWYGLSFATAIMFYILVRRPPRDITKRMRQSSEW